MNTTYACVFPETLPDAGLLVPLVQVFDQVVHMQAVENESLATDSGYLSRCLEMGRLGSFTPAPLGPERDRFMALVEDMRRNGADYTTQLSMLTLAGLQRGGQQRESSGSLISDLLKRTDIRTEEVAQLQLWQSRLMLKLGEWFDAQQTDIGSALSHITTRQQDLFQELREEDELPFSQPSEAGQSSAESASMLKHRLKAWARLYFHDLEQTPRLLITRHALAMELLQEVYEKIRRQEASVLVSLPLPCLALRESPGAQPLLQKLPRLQAALSQLMAPLAPEAAATLADDWRQHQADWKELLEEEFPQHQAGRCQLEFIYFPNISAKRLMMEGFAAGKSDSGTGTTSQEQGCCLALLQER
jgi:hypothetical protein